MKNNAIFRILIFLLFLGMLLVIYKITSQKKETGYISIQKKSSCVNCHSVMTGFSEGHQPSKVSCVSCHLGNNSSSFKDEAHRTMYSVPGNLSNASQTCAKCHIGIDIRVGNSIMNTMSGIISVDKYVFNENDNLDSLFNIHHLKNKSFSDKHLRNKCASCHIGNEKLHPNPIAEKSRGGGCTACHLNYSDNGKIAHQDYINSNKEILPKIHPSLSLKVTDNHCFGCHSRSGRISTNYEGWHETTLMKEEITNSKKYRILEDGRVFEKQTPDIHHTMGLSCIDCHDSFDVMGDGNRYAHQEDAVHVTCTTCHFTDVPKTVLFDDLNNSEQRIISLKGLSKASAFVYSKTDKKTLLNVIREHNDNYLITKNTNEKLLLSKPTANCTKDTHKSLNCSTCHTSWAPQCISCHTKFDTQKDGYDLLAKKWGIGKWIEKGNDYLAEFPTLGVQTRNGKTQIKTFAPGMIMHLKKDTTKSNFHRLFAPISSHTTSKKGKSCKTCHNNPVALGYGRGELLFINGKWLFKPKYNLEKDGLPRDAWIPFLIPYSKAKSTHKNVRPFSVEEQQRILSVGACLTCHKEKSKVTSQILSDYKVALKAKKSTCLSPNFK